MSDDRRSLANLLRADLSAWGVGAEGYDPETGETVREDATLLRWCEWGPRVILAARWPHGAESVAVYWDVMERVEEASGRPLHGRVYTRDEIEGERGVMHLAVVADLWDRDALARFVAWLLDEVYARYQRITGEIHPCFGRVAVLEHQLNIATAIAV